MSTILIRNGRVIDPTQGIDEVTPVAIAAGKIFAIGKSAPSGADQVIDAAGHIVAPGLIDMHVHLREPGHEEKETIETGTLAAAAGGFTAVACMPNTQPPLDSDAQVEFVRRQARRVGRTRVYPVGALTKGRQGRELAEIGLMIRAGAVAFSDDGDGIADAGVCLRAMQYVSMFDRLFIQHCEDKSLAGRGCMHQGVTSTRLGLAGVPAAAEDVMVQRDVLLQRLSGVRYHVAHISTSGAVALVRRAKREGQQVTCEVCPHHLLLTDESCVSYDTNFKMNPPLRSGADVAACIEGVRDGTIDTLVTDHAPHGHQDKEQEFPDAPFGIIGLETAVGLFAKALIDTGVIGWPRLIEMLSTTPARLLRVEGGSLSAESPADVTIIDPGQEWTVDPERMFSKSRNTPFGGWRLRGRPVTTIVGGEIRWNSRG